MSSTNPEAIRSDMSEPRVPDGLSTLGLQLHLCSALVSAFTDRVGFVPDDFLDKIAEDVSLAVIELDVADLWQRTNGGYQIPGPQLRTVIAMLHEL